MTDLLTCSRLRRLPIPFNLIICGFMNTFPLIKCAHIQKKGIKSRPGILLSKESDGLSEGSPCGHERGGAGKCDGKSHLTMFKHYWLTQTKCRSRSHHARSIIRTIVLHFCLPRPSDRHKSVQPLVRFQCAPLSLCLSGDIILPHRCVDNRELYALRRSAGGSPGAPS